MSAYAYRRYRPAARYRYRPRRKGQDKSATVIAAVIVLAIAGAGTKAAVRHGSAGAGTAVAAQAISYARSELGKPYLWGGTGPDAFDCSGLVMMAWRAAGVNIARTTFDQWKTESHVSSPEPGDLVFFAGSDGTMTDPGHVGIVTGGGKMIQALGTGYPVMVSTWHRPDLVGFTQPWGVPAAAGLTARISGTAAATGTLDCAGLTRLWEQAGGSPAAAFTAAEIAMAESSGRQYATLHNTDGTTDRGFWQVNSIHGSLSTYDPAGNARAAVRISRDGADWSAWVTYDTGAYRGRC